MKKKAITKQIKNYDQDWITLILYAKHTGLSPNEVRNLLKQLKENNTVSQEMSR
ncbi:anti-repressor SinI family protein [Oceanobacillus kapialis]|uniref:Anti-repressor SinI family protein n=1 Tax=Oceanobacillus kapialis TaxID=481353 RepID=A0ABW5Q343_9BACI